MKKVYMILLAFGFFLMGSSLKAQTYQQVWSDEFNGSIGPDWTFETGGGGWGNSELEYYQAANATVSNGNLVITARNQSVGGENYTSARMNTAGHQSWTYGKVEASIKVPSVQGLWPAFWMLGDNISSVGWPACGEIDIMEQVNTSTTNYGTIHWNNGGAVQYGGNIGTTGGVYHDYSIIWDNSAITWYVDGTQYVQANIANNINNTGCFHNAFFIILNLAVGGNWPGNSIGALPASMYVDYVRVSQLTSGGGGGNAGAPVGSWITLQGSNGLYVSSNNGTSPMTCDRTTAQGWEKFLVVDAGNGLIELEGENNLFVSSENGASTGMNCNRATPQGWEQFKWVSQGNGQVSLQGSNNDYVSSNNGTSPITCDRTTAQGWEIFNWAATTKSVTLTEQGGSADQTVKIYPTLVSSDLKVDNGLSGLTKLYVFDSTGERMIDQVVAGGTNNVDVSSLPNGIYIVKVVNGSFVKTVKIVKQ